MFERGGATPSRVRLRRTRQEVACIQVCERAAKHFARLGSRRPPGCDHSATIFAPDIAGPPSRFRCYNACSNSFGQTPDRTKGRSSELSGQTLHPRGD